MTEYQLLLRNSTRQKKYMNKLLQKHGNEIINDFIKAKSDYNFQLSDIGIKYGFTRERARQIFLKLYREPYSSYQTRLSNERIRGKTFGCLKAINRIDNDNWLCVCVCGNITIARATRFLYTPNPSCGCTIKTHGMSKTKAYRRWANMLGRCRKKTHSLYKYYGARGITVCKRWLDFENFYKDMGDCPKGLTIERMDNDKGYSPDNCKWGTYKEQANNRRPSSKICLPIEFKGQKLTRPEWAKKLGLNYDTLWIRLQRWSIERALTEPLQQH